MRRKAMVAAATVAACGAGAIAVATPAEAAAWRNVGGKAVAYNGTLDRVDFADKGAGWAVGSQGSILSPKTMIVRWNGTAWARQASPVGLVPTGVAAAGAKRAWIVGFNLADRTVGLYWNGTKWSKVSYPTVGMPFMVSAGRDGTAYSLAGIDSSAGGLSSVLRWNGKAWVKINVPLPPSSSVTAVQVRGKNDVWLAGTTTDGIGVTAFMLRWDGKSWKRIDVPGSMGTPAYRAVMHRIVVASPTNVYLDRVSQTAQLPNALMRWNGKTWKTINTPLNAAGLAMSSDGKSGVVIIPVTTGNRSQYMHYNGSAWRTLNGPVRNGAKVQGGDLDHRPGTPGIVGVGAAAAQNKSSPFIEYFG
ncbi:hypothetical protein ACGFNU_46030 [Spirillospora sp. NPDC048911]|uniref:hypothetical protein n=1 Tax=Spirillospora sp. NPDC048911 TaxID=3364527 RepID=UPI003718CCCC